MRMDAELSLGTTDMGTWVGDGDGMVAIEDAVVSAVDMGSAPFGATDLILMARAVEAFVGDGTTAVTITLASRDTTPNTTVAQWTKHGSMPARLEADLTLNEWFQPIRVPFNAGRYLSIIIDCTTGETLTAGMIQAFFIRECDLPLASPQLFPTP